MFKIILKITLITLTTLISTTYIFKKRFMQNTQYLIGKIKEIKPNKQADLFKYSEIEDLPIPVANYFKKVLQNNQKKIVFAELTQTGKFKRSLNQPWQDISAYQIFTTKKPAYLWLGNIKFIPLINIKGRDSYIEGKGQMLIKFLSAFTVADAKGKELDISALTRFLAESPWLPTALLPSNYIKWEAIDNQNAKVTIQDNYNSASGIFTFNKQNEIIKFSTNDRYMEENGTNKKYPWIAYYKNYKTIKGITIPTKGYASWVLPEKEFCYGIFEIENINYHY